MRPFAHAILAALYIASVVTILDRVLGGTEEGQLGILAPIAGLSLLVLSVAVMAYLFFYKPVTLYVEGAKKEAVTFFLTTLGSFAGFVLLLFGTILAL